MTKLETSFSSLAEISEEFRKFGCDEIVVKFLSENQDNEKNQIYFGPKLSIAQYFPGTLELRSASKSTAKAKSSDGSPIVSLQLDFAWLWPNESPSPAPNAKVIEYSQYPEVRFSGFLQGSPHSPRALRREEQDDYGQRVLILGHSGEKTFGAVVSERSSPQAVAELRKLSPWALQNLFSTMKLTTSTNVLDSSSLLAELRALAGQVHEPRKLKRVGFPVEFISTGGQAGGWTLEALFGIPMNAKSEPDKYGFEIKAVGGDRTSLITTEPDFGYRYDNGVEAYIARFGRDAQAGGGSRVFSGVHRCNRVNPATGAMLTIENWDFTSNIPTGNGQPNIALVEVSSGEVISGWSFGKIGSSWMKKHAGAAFVQCTAEEGPPHDGYSYGPLTYLGLGTSALRFLTQVANGTIFLDPGDSQKLGQSPHARTQWRIAGNIKTQLPQRLEPLYDQLRKEVLF
jgi:hypothetical protein